MRKADSTLSEPVYLLIKLIMSDMYDYVYRNRHELREIPVGYKGSRVVGGRLKSVEGICNLDSLEIWGTFKWPFDHVVYHVTHWDLGDVLSMACMIQAMDHACDSYELELAYCKLPQVLDLAEVDFSARARKLVLVHCNGMSLLKPNYDKDGNCIVGHIVVDQCVNFDRVCSADMAIYRGLKVEIIKGRSYTVYPPVPPGYDRIDTMEVEFDQTSYRSGSLASTVSTEF